MQRLIELVINFPDVKKLKHISISINLALNLRL